MYTSVKSHLVPLAQRTHYQIGFHTWLDARMEAEAVIAGCNFYGYRRFYGPLTRIHTARQRESRGEISGAFFDLRGI